MNDSRECIRIMVVGGVRPQFIKCAALQRAIGEHNVKSRHSRIDALFINAGQHYDDELAGSLIHDLGVTFDVTLAHANKSPIQILGQMIVGIGNYLLELQGHLDWVVVFGDANPALAGAIAAAKTKHQLAHFEAGVALHSTNTPEVINGKLIMNLADVHFCPSEYAARSLRQARVDEGVYVVGDITRDLVISYSDSNTTEKGVCAQRNYILLTLHHEENVESAYVLSNIIDILERYQYPVLFVTHPRTKRKLDELKLPALHNIKIIPPLTHKQMLLAIRNCRFLVTDSGGLHRESYYLKKRCLVRLDVDYWPNLTSANVHKRIGSDRKSIESGLKWMESTLTSDNYPHVSELDSPNGAEKALLILVELTLARRTAQGVS